jgi:hypothetical protein
VLVGDLVVVAAVLAGDTDAHRAYRAPHRAPPPGDPTPPPDTPGT